MFIPIDVKALSRQALRGYGPEDPEPLPEGHPLWELALAITPHNAGDTVAADERAIRFGAEQLGRYLRGEPLQNVVLAPES